VTPLAKRLLIALCISFGLNLLAAGVVLGRVFDRGRGKGPPDRARDAGAERAPEKSHGKMPRAFGRRGPEGMESRRAVRKAREEARAALEKEPFDPAPFEAALGRVRAETTRGQELLHRKLVENAKRGPEERRKLGVIFGRGTGHGEEQ
jgi:uncharacterized membrane protein